MSERISGALQENILALLCFSEKAAALIRNAVDPKLFSSELYREAVGRCYEFIDSHKAPPGDHLPDLLEDVLSRRGDPESAKQAELALNLVEHVFALKGNVNESYVLAQLEGFVRRQRLTSSLIKASALIQEGDVEAAEVEVEKGLRTRLELFSPGTRFAEGWRKAFRGEVRVDVLPTGIKPLDDWELGPARGELHLFLGPPKRAKTWWLINLGKKALTARLRVLYVTLELSEEQVVQRFVQSLFSLQKKRAKVELSRLESDELGRFVRFEREEMTKVKSLLDGKAEAFVAERMDKLRVRNNLIVKRFPTRGLSIKGLRAYLDALERAHNFIPDVLIVDYPDLMDISAKFRREELGNIFQDLRGIGVERNMIVPTVSQANRAGAEAKLMTEADVSEDWSKVFTADTVFTYSQTIAEKELGLARIFVSNTRVSERDRFVVLISQAYQVGQFCVDAATMADKYWAQLKEVSGEPERKPRGDA